MDTQETKTRKVWLFTQENGDKVEVPLERWCWQVVYKDGTRLKQFDDNGVFHQLKEIDQNKVIAFSMVRSDNPDQVHTIILPEGAKLIHKYRVRGLVEGGQTTQRGRVYIFGYKPQGGKPHYNFIHRGPDGSDIIVQTHGDQEIGLHMSHFFDQGTNI